MKWCKYYAIWLSKEVLTASVLKWKLQWLSTSSGNRQFQKQFVSLVIKKNVSPSSHWKRQMCTYWISCSWIWCDLLDCHRLKLVQKESLAARSSYCQVHQEALLGILLYFFQSAGVPNFLRSCPKHLAQFNSDGLCPVPRDLACMRSRWMLKLVGTGEMAPVSCYHTEVTIYTAKCCWDLASA